MSHVPGLSGDVTRFWKKTFSDSSWTLQTKMEKRSQLQKAYYVTLGKVSPVLKHYKGHS